MALLERILTSYSLVDVILILFLLAFAAKEVLQLKDFFHNRNRKRVDEENEEQQTSEKILEKISDLEDQFTVLYDETTTSFESIKATLKEHQDTLDLLIQSDKDDIRADIVEKHHYFMAQGYIDDFSIDAIERRYGHYKQEGGNSYITDLMHDLRKLPKR